jgi:arylsulfatase A-like enzyme
MSSAMDDAVGLVLNKLRKAGLEEHTLIFYISDNGGPPVNASNNSPLRGHKAQTLEGGIRVPWIVQWQGHLPAGKLYDQPVIQQLVTDRRRCPRSARGPGWRWRSGQDR